MQTQILIELDFDESSKYWRQNKKLIGNGVFIYTCNYFHKNEKKCNKSIKNSFLTNLYLHTYANLYCIQHCKFLSMKNNIN